MNINWIKASEQKPPYNVSVLVFIPEEDNHCTTGMWDVSNKWVLLDEYRVPKSQITYWAEMVNLPDDKTYKPVKRNSEEEDTVTYQMRELQKRIFELERTNRWIPVTERLPLIGQRVLIYCRSQGIQMCYLDFFKNWYMACDLSAAHLNITHWMPLPELPK